MDLALWMSLGRVAVIVAAFLAFAWALRRMRQEYGQPTMKFTLDSSLGSLDTALSMMTGAARGSR